MIAMNKYSDYLEIDDFPSEINNDSIKEMESTDPDWWKKTFPHETFIHLLKITEAMLGRQTYNSKKSLWVQGSYGTGKSRIISTLKKLLECSNEDFNDYFDTYDELKAESDLRNKLLTQRSSGKIITVYRYNCGQINDFNDFIMAIYDDVSKALSQAKVPYAGENTLRGGIISWLEDDVHKNFFNSIIKKQEYCFLGSFAGMTADTILTKLKNSKNVQELIQDLLALAKNEGISAFSKKVEDLKSWLTDIIDQNNLKAIVFFWDEFSEFFRKNKNYLDTFQTFNELSNHKPFNMVIVTHSAMFDKEDIDGKKVRDRFNDCQIELPDTIAFDLISHVIKVKESQKEIWKTTIQTIQDAVIESSKKVAKYVWNNEEQKGISKLNGILPIHPLAALLLKHISTSFASNQRSMFNFIKNQNADGLEAFQWFIKTHSPDGNLNEDDSLLTIDHLWNFFYEKGTDEHSSAAGRSNLDTQIRNILDSYAQNEGMLSNDQKRVLKTVLMLQAMSEKLGYQFPLFLPTEENIELAYDGLMWQGGKAKGIAQQLVQNKILFKKKVGSGKEVFAAAVLSSDTAKIEEKKDNLRKNTDTDLLIKEGDFESIPSLKKAQDFRFKLFSLSWKNFSSEVNKIANEPVSKGIKPFQIPLVLFFARTHEERSKLQKSLKDKLADVNNKKIVFLDLTTPFDEDKFDQYLAYKAQEEYYRLIDKSQADNYNRQAKNFLKDWKDDIAKKVTVYSYDKPEGVNCQSAEDLRKALNFFVLEQFPHSFDNTQLNDQMWINSQAKKCVSLGIEEQSGGIVPKDIVKFIENNRKTLDEIKSDLDNYIKEQLRTQGHVAISNLFDILQEKGFMPCNLYAYLTGWLLRDYSQNQYRCSDGKPGNSVQMDNEKMATIVSECIKHKYDPASRYNDQYIEKLTEEQRAFVNLAHSIWNDISDEQSVEVATTEIRRQLENLEYPLWAFKELDCQGTDEFLVNLGILANVKNSVNTESNAETEAKKINELGQYALHNPDLGKILKSLLTPENASKAMEKFLEHFENGDLLHLSKEIQVDNVMYEVKVAFNKRGLWLWNQETGNEVILNLIVKYRFVAISNRLLHNNANSYSDALSNWDEKIKSFRIPYLKITQKCPSVKNMLKFFYDRRENELPDNRIPDLVKALEDSESAFKEFEKQIIQVFKEAFNFQLGELSDDDIQKLYSELPGDSFYKTPAEMQTIITQKTQSIIEGQLYFKLQNLWKEKTGTESPQAWSEKFQTPILAMVPSKEQDWAREVFDTINNQKNKDSSSVQDAIQYLQGNHEYFNNLNNQAIIDEAFMTKIVRNYASLLDNPNEVREALMKHVPNCYKWMDNYSITELVEQMGEDRYNTQGLTKVQDKVEKMNDQQVRELLMWLVNNSPETGIKILTDYEG